MAKFQPGHKRLGGRKPGTPNKFTTLKNAWTNVFVRMGDEDALLAYAEKHPAWFYGLITKLFPQEVAHSGEVSAVLKFDFGENGNGKADE